ncbi:hypothetical protein [Alkaliphilus hydrothermalis]|uniref:DMSO reductase anchor subunit n=1 Tax=Alkaliphilus hydrothermalis TaxID=1482730 RepID=A0ABS2NSG4_9FIRM|nr:hypothetical protein [Alkaliphilus hydrothermalis]MBM7615807.1 DMSO reductase anchor subunit [Alkaliphilus hydrothermalis]
MIIGLTIGYILMMIFDIPLIIKSNKIKKVIILYLTISLLGFTLSLLQILDKQPLSPSNLIAKIIDTFVK